MDGNEQVGVQTISVRRTLEQTRHPGPARDQSDCFVEPCFMQRLRDHVGELYSPVSNIGDIWSLKEGADESAIVLDMDKVGLDAFLQQFV